MNVGGNNKFVIYYNASDIFLGTALLILVVFFIHDYLSHALSPGNDCGVYVSTPYTNNFKINPLNTKP